MAHSIRLREPWDSRYVDGTRKAVRYRRFFNRPTGIESGQQVFLTLRVLVACSLNVSVNEHVSQLIPTGDSAYRARVDQVLSNRNQIELTVAPENVHESLPQECPKIGQQLISQVIIEIED